MPVEKPRPRWYLVPVRVLLVSLLFTVLAFALSTLVGIVSITLWAHSHGNRPALTLAYRSFAFPIAIGVAVVAVIALSVLEVRHHRQATALAAIERAQRARSDSSR